MRSRYLLCGSLVGVCSIVVCTATGCGGTVETSRQRDRSTSDSGATGGVLPGSGATGTVTGPSMGGAPGGAFGNETGGAGGGGWSMGGAGGASGGAVGAGCQNVFSPLSWQNRCAPSAGCLSLDPNTWLPAEASALSADGGADAGGTTAEAQFCSAPMPNRNYLFAFEESGAWYDDFNIATSDRQCEGRSLGFLGIGGVGDAPLTRVRTHCFSVPGELLGSWLAIVSLDRDASITNLRAVSSCDCAYPMPYNTNSCAGIEGGGGHPNCG